jgi:cobalt-zinc-cadmium efflux system outer membrane protein
VTIDQALDLYRQRNARLAAERAQVDVAAADLVEARIYPNPEAGFSTTRTTLGDTAGPQMQYQLDVAIPILIGHQRGKREHAAVAHVAEAKRDVDADQADAELAIRDRFQTLLAAQEKTTVLDAALADETKVREIVAGRSSAGAGSSYAVERIDLAIAELASRVSEARADETAASLALAVAVGVPAWQPQASGTLAADVPAAAAPDRAHPLLAQIEARFASARADEARAHADAVPTPSLGLTAFTTTTPEGLGLAGGISIPLPLFDKNQGAVARARAEAHRADLELVATTIELSGELAAATRDLAARQDALTHFQADALQRLAKIRDMAEVSYKSGQGGIVELLDALDAITEARLRELELRLDVAQASLSVRRASRGR